MADSVLIDLETVLVTDRHANFCALSCPNLPEGLEKLMFCIEIPKSLSGFITELFFVLKSFSIVLTR